MKEKGKDKDSRKKKKRREKETGEIDTKLREGRPQRCMCVLGLYAIQTASLRSRWQSVASSARVILLGRR